MTQIQGFFHRRKVATIQELIDFSQKSISTVKRRLKDLEAYRSYSHNSRYYVLPETVHFNGDGLWKHKGIKFSKYGSLRQSISYLVEQSPQGLSEKDLSELLEYPVHNLLSEHFKENSELLREKEEGRYIYFSGNSHVYAVQRQRREKLKQSQAKEHLPSHAHAVVVLVELIQHPSDKLDQLTRRVRRRGITISREEVRNLLLSHGLLKNFGL